MGQSRKVSFTVVGFPFLSLSVDDNDAVFLDNNGCSEIVAFPTSLFAPIFS